jgi:hypothetical protein
MLVILKLDHYAAKLSSWISTVAADRHDVESLISLPAVDPHSLNVPITTTACLHRKVIETTLSRSSFRPH